MNFTRYGSSVLRLSTLVALASLAPACAAPVGDEQADGEVGRNAEALTTFYKWDQLPVSGMVDAEEGVALNGRRTTWVVGGNGTAWYSSDGQSWSKMALAGASRVAGGQWMEKYCGNFPCPAHYFSTWFVKTDGALVRTIDNVNFETMPIGDVIDVAVVTGIGFGTVWVTTRDGSIYSSASGRSWTKSAASGFKRISADRGGVYGVGYNGTLWRRPLNADSWTQLLSAGVTDVAAFEGDYYFTKTDGTVFRGGASTPSATGGNGFASIGRSDRGALGTGTNQTVWRVRYETPIY